MMSGQSEFQAVDTGCKFSWLFLTSYPPSLLTTCPVYLRLPAPDTGTTAAQGQIPVIASLLYTSPGGSDSPGSWWVQAGKGEGKTGVSIRVEGKEYEKVWARGKTGRDKGEEQEPSQLHRRRQRL